SSTARPGNASPRPPPPVAMSRKGSVSPLPSTVRDAVFDVLRARGVDRIFGNPGSTEVGLLADLPDDLRFVLALHEGSVVGLAGGYAVASGRPALALLHTAAGYGNAVG